MNFDGISSDYKGSILILLLFVSLVILLSGFGIWSCLRYWRILAATQLRLDRCVQKFGLELKSKLNTIEQWNDTMKELRIAGVVSQVNPPIAKAIKGMLQIIATKQDLEKLSWDLKKIQWRLQRGCDYKSDVAWPLQSIHWTREPPDQIGQNPIQWSGESVLSFRVQLGKRSRAAAAVIYRKGQENFSRLGGKSENPKFSQFQGNFAQFSKLLSNTTEKMLSPKNFFQKSEKWTAKWAVPQGQTSGTR